MGLRDQSLCTKPLLWGEDTGIPVDQVSRQATRQGKEQNVALCPVDKQ